MSRQASPIGEIAVWPDALFDHLLGFFSAIAARDKREGDDDDGK